MVIARVVRRNADYRALKTARVHLQRTGWAQITNSAAKAMERGLSAMSVAAERLQGFSPSSVCIVGAIRYVRRKMPLIFSNARKGYSLPIEIISGNEEAPDFYGRRDMRSRKRPQADDRYRRRVNETVVAKASNRAG